MADRTITSNVAEPVKFYSNKISTTKYNVFTAVPIQFVSKFTNLVNVYFVFIAMLLMDNEILSVIYVPLFLILLILGLKYLYEDKERQEFDLIENQKLILYNLFLKDKHKSRNHFTEFYNIYFETRRNLILHFFYEILKVQVYRQNTWMNVLSESLLVGEIVKVGNNQYFPADLLCIYSTNYQGNCYISTLELDGEANQKQKSSIKVLQEMEEANVLDKKFVLNFEKPNGSYDKFEGMIEISKENGLQESMQVDNKNLILRGYQLKNTNYVIGLVTYAGKDTKVMMNKLNADSKISDDQRRLYYWIQLVFYAQLIFFISSSIFNNYKFICYLALNRIIPISLLIILEVVKYRSILRKSNNSSQNDIQSDVQSSDTKKELKQVEHSFTENSRTQMNFKCLSVNGVSYGEEHNMTSKELEEKPSVTNVNFFDRRIFEDLNGKSDKGNEQQKQLFIAFKLLSVCHDVIVDKTYQGVEYLALSSDEIALINFAKFCGFEYLEIDYENYMRIKQDNIIHSYLILDTLDYSSTRKRMSKIVKDQDGKILLFCKGAESILKQLLDPNQNSEQVNEVTWAHLKKYGSMGLRTLVLAQKEISMDQYDEWRAQYIKVMTHSQNREEDLDSCYNEIEKNLILIGATAVGEAQDSKVMKDNESLTQKKNE